MPCSGLKNRDWRGLRLRPRSAADLRDLLRGLRDAAGSLGVTIDAMEDRGAT
jgi:hypothetical protein